MKHGAGVLAALALAGVTAGAARAQDPIAEVKKRGLAFAKAVETKDRKALEGFFHPDGVFISPEGNLLNRKGYLDEMLEWAKGRTFTNQESLGLRHRVYGGTVIETGTYRATGTLKGKPFVHETHYTDVWAKVKGVWVLLNEQGTYTRGSRK